MIRTFQSNTISYKAYPHQLSIMLRIVSLFYQIAQRLSFFFNKISRRFAKAALELNTMKYHIQFGEREDDIYIVTYPKSGTTLMQMIIYQLTTEGRMDFNHIYDVSPWTDNDAFLNLTPRDLPSPRIIKSHRIQNKFDKNTKGKFIVVFRNGYDVAASQYHQNKNYNDPKLKFDDFFNDFTTKNQNWFEHCKSWLENRNKAEILYVNYEDLLNNFDICLQNIASFIGVEIEPSNLPRIKERCSFSFMKEHESKFGEIKQEVKEQKVYDQFIRKGEIGKGALYFSQEQKDIFEKQLKKYNML